MPIENLPAICISRLTRLLDLNVLEQIQELENQGFVTQNVEIESNEEDSQNEHGRRRSTSKPEDKRFHLRRVKKMFRIAPGRAHSSQVFGTHLTENAIETIVTLMDHLKKYSHMEGLFRISGNKRRQDELKEALNKGNPLNLNDDIYNPHDIATVLKQFLAELPEPIFHQSLLPCYKQVAEMEGESATPKKVKILQYLFLLLPPLNRLLLQKLIELLNIVAHNPSSKMTSYNLGVVFAPNVICSKKFISCLDDYADNMEPLTDVIAFVVDHGLDVFKIPDDLMQEYKRMKSDTEADPGKVKMIGTYCKQVDPGEYRKQVQSNTNDALTDLYAGVLAMPDGHLKDQFLAKFKKSYPGTPPFIPRKAKVKDKILQSAPAQRVAPVSTIRNKYVQSIGREDISIDNEVFLTTPEKKRLFQEDDRNDSPTPISQRLSEVRKSPITPSARLRAKLGKLRRSSVGMKALSTLRKLPTPELKSKLNIKVHSNRGKSRVTPVPIVTELDESPSKRRRKSLFHPFDVEAKSLNPTRTFCNTSGDVSPLSRNMRRDTLPSSFTPSFTSATFFDAVPSDSQLLDSENEKPSEDLTVKNCFPSIRAPLMNLNSFETKKVEFRGTTNTTLNSKSISNSAAPRKRHAELNECCRPGGTPAKVHRHPALRVKRTPLKSTEKLIAMRDSPRQRPDKNRTTRRVTFASYGASTGNPQRPVHAVDVTEEAEWQAILEKRQVAFEHMETDSQLSESSSAKISFPKLSLADGLAGDTSQVPARRATLNLMQSRKSDSDVVPTSKSSNIFDVYTRRLSGSTFEWLQSKHPLLEHAGPPTFL